MAPVVFALDSTGLNSTVFTKKPYYLPTGTRRLATYLAHYLKKNKATLTASLIVTRILFPDEDFKNNF